MRAPILEGLRGIRILRPHAHRQFQQATVVLECLITAPVDEIGAEHPPAIASEHVVAMTLIDAEVRIESVGDGVPGHLPAHPRFQAHDILLRRP
jgi:hypothetical protein